MLQSADQNNMIDKLMISEKDLKRIKQSLQIGMRQGDGIVMILDKDGENLRYFSKRLMCPTSGISYDEPAPNNFSFNSPQGMCPRCKGLGMVNLVDMDKIMPDREQNIHNGGIIPLGKYRDSLLFWQIEAIADKYGFTLKTPIKDIPEEA